MKILSIRKIKYSNLQDESLQLIRSLDGLRITFNSGMLQIEGERFTLSTNFYKTENNPLAGQIQHFFNFRGQNLRFIIPTELAKKINPQENSVIIASERHDNFAVFMNIIDLELKNTSGQYQLDQLKVIQHQNKEIEYEAIIPNPLKIVEFDPFGSRHSIPDLREYYAYVIYQGFEILKRVKLSVTASDLYSLSAFYAIDLMLFYKGRAMGILPREVVTALSRQVSAAANMVSNELKSNIVEKMIDEFTKTYDILELLIQFKKKYNLEALFDDN